MSSGTEVGSANCQDIESMRAELALLKGAIHAAPVPFAVFDRADRLITWNAAYEAIHEGAFAAHRDRATAGTLNYREIMRFQLDASLQGEALEAELDRLASNETSNAVQTHVRNLGAKGHFKVYRYRAESGARAGIAVDVNDLIATQRELVDARNLAEENARRLQAANTEIRSHAYYDELTGLPNRRLLIDTLERLRNEPQSAQRPCTVLHIDLDKFKQVNDMFGHAAGDHVLRHTASLLQRSLRSKDIVVRLGGDEFALLLVDDCDAKQGKALAQHLIDELQVPIDFQGSACRVGASIGVSEHRLENAELDHILSCSDLAMYRAKARGRNRVEVFDQALNDELQRKKVIGDILYAAVQDQQFLPYYQPQFRCADKAWVGVEALCRWQHPDGKLLSPGEFFDSATAMALIGDIDRCLFAHLDCDLDAFAAAGILPPKLSVNIGLERLLDADLASQLGSLKRPDLAVAVELLESLSIDEDVLQALESLKHNGVHVEIDDFGSERASISSLVSVSPSVMKIDRKIVIPGLESERMRKLIRSIVDIGRALDIAVVAEGVESEQHIALVRELGCDYMQGIALCEPLSCADLIDRFSSHAPDQYRRVA